LVVWRKKGQKFCGDSIPKQRTTENILQRIQMFARKPIWFLTTFIKAVLFFKALETLEGIVLSLKLKKVLEHKGFIIIHISDDKKNE
jgi:hypothetical protein